jgi:hypothetical protein
VHDGAARRRSWLLLSVLGCAGFVWADLGPVGAAEPPSQEAITSSVASIEEPAASPRQGASGAVRVNPPQVVPLAQTPPPSHPLLSRRIGCLPDLSASTLDRAFRDPFGPIVGFDNVHVIELGPQRYLWLLHDAYVRHDGAVVSNLRQARALANVALLQEGACFSIVHRGSLATPRAFEPGDGWVGSQRFFWPLGGEVFGNHVLVFWAEMVQSALQPAPGDGGILRHPVGTWLAVYDRTTLERQHFGPAPNPGVMPQYGFAVSSDDEYSYLFGNPNLLNPAMSGGLANGPHPATRTYLARVPRGLLFLPPEYWTGRGWSRDAGAAVPISERYWMENTMQPRRIGDEWWSITKADGFWGNDLVLERADAPWGPWQTVSQFRYEPRFGSWVQNSYQPILLPWREPDGRLITVISQNAHDWLAAVAYPPYYRPAAISL